MQKDTKYLKIYAYQKKNNLLDLIYMEIKKIVCLKGYQENK